MQYNYFISNFRTTGTYSEQAFCRLEKCPSSEVSSDESRKPWTWRLSIFEEYSKKAPENPEALKDRAKSSSPSGRLLSEYLGTQNGATKSAFPS